MFSLKYTMMRTADPITGYPHMTKTYRWGLFVPIPGGHWTAIGWWTTKRDCRAYAQHWHRGECCAIANGYPEGIHR
jgi:hypothetical protein